LQLVFEDQVLLPAYFAATFGGGQAKEQLPKMTLFYGNMLLAATSCSLYCHFILCQLVFTEVVLGAVVLPVNVILLGGNIVIFQSLWLIGCSPYSPAST
jgi:hypothetical protein